MKLFSSTSLKLNANKTAIFKKIVSPFEKKAAPRISTNGGPSRAFSVLHRLLPKKKSRKKSRRLLREKKKAKRISLVVKKLNCYALATKKVLSTVHGAPTKARLRTVRESTRKKRRKAGVLPWRGKALKLRELLVKVRSRSKNKQKESSLALVGRKNRMTQKMSWRKKLATLVNRRRRWVYLKSMGRKKKMTKKLGLWGNLAPRLGQEKPTVWWKAFRPSTQRKVILKNSRWEKKSSSFWIHGLRAKSRPAKVLRSSIKKKQEKHRTVVYRPISRHKQRLNPRFVRKKRRWYRRKYKFSRWKIFEYRRFRFSFRDHLGFWATMALFPHKVRRRRHQPYRFRQARALKKNKWFRLLAKGKKPGFAVSRPWRLRNQQQYQKLYSFFYGIYNRKTKKKESRHFLRIKESGAAKRNILFSWVERRLDVVLCRIRLAPTIKVARSLISRGFVWVNKKQSINPNRRVQVWDVVTVNRKKLAFLRYWYLRGRFRRYIFKKKALRFKYIHPQKSSRAFGFLMKLPFEADVPKKDLTTVSEVERLFLTD